MNGIRSSSASRIVASRSAGSFVGERLVGDEVGPQRLEHQPLADAVTSRSRARSSRPSAPRFVCGSSPRSSARSQHHTT